MMKYRVEHQAKKNIKPVIPVYLKYEGGAQVFVSVGRLYGFHLNITVCFG